ESYPVAFVRASAVSGDVRVGNTGQVLLTRLSIAAPRWVLCRSMGPGPPCHRLQGHCDRCHRDWDKTLAATAGRATCASRVSPLDCEKPGASQIKARPPAGEDHSHTVVTD